MADENIAMTRHVAVHCGSLHAQLETVVKASSAALLPGGGGKEPTIISPGQYARRFRRALGRYFVVAPTT